MQQRGIVPPQGWYFFDLAMLRGCVKLLVLALPGWRESRRSLEMILEGFLLTLVRDQIPVAIQLQQAPISGSYPVDLSNSATYAS